MAAPNHATGRVLGRAARARDPVMSENSEAIPWLTVKLWQALVDQRLLPDARVELLEALL
ncbi:MAG: hypothetical protein ACR2RL_05880, partial [Gammaproteobacteria bacterium]